MVHGLWTGLCFIPTLRLVRFRPHHFFAEVGVVLFARALIITLLFSLGKMASMLESKGEL